MPYSTLPSPRTPEEQAAMLQRYEWTLERAVGLEPGESKLSDEEILARRAARRTDARHSASQPRPNPRSRPLADPDLARIPFAAVLGRLRSRPGMFEHLEGLDTDGVSNAPLGPPPMDPVGRMHWRARLESHQRAAQMTRRHKAVNNELLLMHLRAHDPLFSHVRRFIDNHVEALPEKIKRAILEQVDRTPGVFLDMYADMRRHLVQGFNLSGDAVAAMPPRAHRMAQRPASARRSPGPAFAAPDPREGSRLPDADRLPPTARQASDTSGTRLAARRSAELTELVARANARQAREGDLQRYLALCMNIDLKD